MRIPTGMYIPSLEWNLAYILQRIRNGLESGEISCAVDDHNENFGLYLFKDYKYNPKEPAEGLLGPSEVLVRVRVYFFYIYLC